MREGHGTFATFNQLVAVISEMVPDMAKVTTDHQWEVACK